MKKIYFFALVIFSVATNAQTSSYKNALNVKGSNYFEIVKQAREELSPLKKSTLKKDIKQIKQFERWAFYWRDRVDANGNFPSELQGYSNAGIIDANGKLIQNNTEGLRTSSSQTWTNIGPQDIPEANGYPNFPQMGRLSSYFRFLHPTASQNVLFIGAPNGGVWKSTDNGTTWSPKLDFIAGIGVTDVRSSSTDATATNQDKTIYVSTGDYDGAHIKSIGVLKSTDFGETYNATALSFNLEDQESTSNLIVMDYQTVIVGTNKYIKKNQ